MVLLSAAYLIGGAAVMGTDRVLIREIAKNWRLADSSKIIPVGSWGITRVIIFSFVGALFLFIWLAASKNDIGNFSKTGLIFLLLLAPASTSLIMISSFLVGMGNVKLSQALSNPIRNMLLLLGVVLCSGFSIARQAEYIVAVQVASFFFCSLMGWLWIRYKNRGPKFIEYWEKKTLNVNSSSWNISSWHFFIGTAGLLLLHRLDIILVNTLSNSVTAGIYGAAVRIGQIVAIVGLSGSIWLHPKIVKHLHQERKKDLFAILKQGMVLIGSATFLLSIGVFWGADYIAGLLGPDFSIAADPLRWIAFGYTVWAVGVPFYAFLLMSGSEAVVAKILWAQVSVNIVMLFILVPIYGAHGAAMGLGVWYDH